MSAQRYYAAEYDRHPELAITPLSKHGRLMVTASILNLMAHMYPARVWVDVQPKKGSGAELIPGELLGHFLIRLSKGVTWLELIHEFAHLDGVLLRGWKAEKHDRIHALAVDMWAAHVLRHWSSVFEADYLAAMEDPARHIDPFSVGN